jgi:chemotaxis protein CheD
VPETPVRIGELIATRDPEAVLVSVGLGSCIGLAMIDRARGVAGLAHVMLPESKAGQEASTLRGRYADRAVPVLLDEVVALGARVSALEVGIAGGAQMFGGSSIEVGRRNEEAVRAALTGVRLAVTAAETGGDKGRTVRVHPDGGVMTVRQVADEEIVLIGSPPVAAASGRDLRRRVTL